MKNKKKQTNKQTKKQKPRVKKEKMVEISSPIGKDAKFFVAAELADDRIIEKEVLGQATKVMVYKYENKAGEIISGLSYNGVREAVRLINRMKNSGHVIQISDRPPIIDRSVTMYGAEGVEVQVYAVDLQGGGGSWGIKFEPWQRPIHDGKGGTAFNRFALEMALSKAQRNAMFNLLPVELIEKMIEKLSKEKGTVEKIKGPDTETRVIKPRATGKEKVYRATLSRVGKIKSNKKSLEEALKNIDSMPISGQQRGQIRRKISRYLKTL